MKKSILFVTVSAIFILFSCNDDNSANRSDKQDASNTTMDEIGPVNSQNGDTTHTNSKPISNTNIDAPNANPDNTDVRGNQGDKK